MSKTNERSLRLQVDEIGNNRYKINGETVYAPNVQTAIQRYMSVHDAGAKVLFGGKV